MVRRRLVGHRLVTAWVKVLRLCFPMTTEADLLEAAATLVFTVRSSWSTVEKIAQASDDITKVVPKVKLAPVTSVQSLLKLIFILHSYKSIYTEFLGCWSGWSFKLVTSKLNL